MRYSVLNSSSSGNATYLETDKLNILLDAGITPKNLLNKLDSLNITFKGIDYIFITHEHYDHIGMLNTLNKSFAPIIVMTKGTYDGLSENIKKSISPINIKIIGSEDELKLDGLTVKSFKTSHDANEPCGYMFIENNKTLVYLTDTGEFNKIDELKNKDSYIIESNHEIEMLELSRRPWVLINRIESKYGHMSNEYSANLFNNLKGINTKTVTLFHLSSECNTKELAMLAYKKVIENTEIKLTISDKNKPTNIIEV